MNMFNTLLQQRRDERQTHRLLSRDDFQLQ
jgi:hypothetical protein